jgi:hypothetical protein
MKKNEFKFGKTGCGLTLQIKINLDLTYTFKISYFSSSVFKVEKK